MMKAQKEYNEYGDKLVSMDAALDADICGFRIPQIECYTISARVPKEKALILEEWSGMISDDQSFLCFRPTITCLQKWLREDHNIHVFISYRMNVGKWGVDAYDMTMGAKKYVETRTMKKFNEQVIYDTYDEALEAGVSEGLQLLLRSK